MLIFSLSILALSTYAWFTYLKTDSFTGEIGFVEVNIDAYFDDGLGGKISADEVEVATGVPKPGIFFINIVSNANESYFEDFRLNVEVYSNVDTYIRVKIYEQLTLTYTNFEGVVTELSILHEEYMPFNYNTIDWYDNRSVDNYIYLIVPAQRTDSATPDVYTLITDYFAGQSFSNYPPGYSLQIGFSIEAVQASHGAENVWGLPTPPWGGSW